MSCLFYAALKEGDSNIVSNTTSVRSQATQNGNDTASKEINTFHQNYPDLPLHLDQQEANVLPMIPMVTEHSCHYKSMASINIV